MDIVDRLFELLAESSLNQQDFADKIGVKKNAISRWKKRELQSYTKYLSQISEVLGTTTEYLLTGEGPKYRPQTPEQFFRYRIIQLCNDTNRDPYHAMKEAGVDTGPVRQQALYAKEFRWRCPKISEYNIATLSKYFDVPAEIFFKDGKVPDWKIIKSVPLMLTQELAEIVAAYEKADEKSRAMVRLALNLDVAEPTASPASDKAM